MTIELFNRHPGIRVNRARLRKLIRAMLEAVEHPREAVHVTLVDDPGMTEVNAETFGKRRPTNVISFPLGDVPGLDERLLGDIIVSVDTAAREAEGAGLSLDHRLAQLIAHGLLHILGYDHVGVDESERRRMKRAEERVFNAVAPLAAELVHYKEQYVQHG